MLRPSRVLVLIGCSIVAAAAWSAEPEASRSWPQWRGPNRDAVSADTGLLQSWPNEGPPMAWKTRGLGSGYASVVLGDGKLYTAGKRRGQDYVLCLDSNTGGEIWAAKLSQSGADDPSSTPTLDGDRVYGLGSHGDLVCLKAKDGKEVWRASYTKDFGGQVPTWKYCESPLIDGDLIIGTPGGDKATLVAFNKLTGKVVWKCLVPEGGGAGDGQGGYSSPVLSEGAGVKQYVQLTGRGVVGVRASDGKFLWKYTAVINGTANIPTPIVTGNYVICSTGYGRGTGVLELQKEGEGVKARQVWFKKGNEIQNHHGGMIRVGDYLYLGHAHNQGFPMCVEWKTGKVVWGGERGPGGGSAAIVCADGQLYFRYQDGIMALIAATPDGYQLNGRFAVPVAHEPCWSHPVVVGGRLYLRDQEDLLVYNVAK
jgi:outer membrane protein assembly factor BamB